jgi:predicted nucleic acid-binding protein
VSAVADAGPLINLAKLDHLPLLSHTHSPVYLPSAVNDEAVTQGMAHGHADAVLVQRAVNRGDLQVVPLVETDLPSELRTVSLGTGERHAMGLALPTRCLAKSGAGPSRLE